MVESHEVSWLTTGEQSALELYGAMVNALRRLGGLEAGELPKTMNAFGITERGGMMSLFATHPPIEARIAALSGQR